MKHMIEFIKKHPKRFFPQPLPIGVTEFHKWAEEIIELYSFPANDSVKFTLAAMIMHMDPSADRKPYSFFAKRIKKSMANQIAGAIIQELKIKQQEEIEKAKEEQTSKESASEESVPHAPV